MEILQKYNKSLHFENAKNLIQSGDFQSLRYACLELRFFIEAHVYQQLLAGADTIPETVIGTWQPNKAIKMLSKFDVLADQDLRMEVYDSQSGKLKAAIDHPNIPVKELNKTYNTLGSYLHLPTPRKVRGYTINREKIESILDKLAVLNKGNTMFADLGYKHFECEACSSKVVYTEFYVNHNDSIDCQNDQCGISYRIIHGENTVSFGSKYVFDCGICGEEAFVYFSKIEDGYEFECQNCDAKYNFEMILHTPEKECGS